MKLGILFTGGKDSCYAAYLAKKFNHEISCLISIFSQNKDSFMFHTPSIQRVKQQAEVMRVPLVVKKTLGEKETELVDLEKAISAAKEKYGIEGIVSGAIASVYQASRIQKICNKLDLECFNPLWQKDEIEYLKEILKNKFKVILVGVFAYPLNDSYLGKQIDKKFIKEFTELQKRYKIHPAGEGGEFETFVLDCPLFKRELKIQNFHDSKEGENSFRRELEVEK